MPTTTNYGWTTPADTDLVKDGASAIRTLGTAIDTTVFNNASAGIAKTIVDAKGDIIVATAADTVSRLAVGANDTVLVADSTQATGVKWATPSSGGMTLISTTTFNNTVTTYTISSIAQTYKHLMLIGSGLQSNTYDDYLYFRLNGSSGANYNFNGIKSTSAVASFGNTSQNLLFDNYSQNLARPADPTSYFGNFTLDIYDYTTTTLKGINYVGGSISNNINQYGTGRGLWTITDAITSITFASYSGANLKAGIVRLYGVS